jgi:hypothetical protein
MDVRRRNRLIRAFYGLLLCVPVVVIGWALWQTRNPRAPRVTAVRLVVVAAVFAVPLVWAELQFRKSMRQLDEALRETGVDPEQIPEKPLPLVPRLRLAKDRDQLIAGVLFLVLLIFVFVAHYAGWIARWTGENTSGR